MLLEDIISTITDASTEELHEWLREIRHNRTQETFVVEKKEKKTKKVDKLLGEMNPAQMAALKALLDKLG